MNLNVSGQINDAYGKVISWIPNIVGAIIIFIIGYLIALAIRAGVKALLHSARTNEHYDNHRYSSYIKRLVRDPEQMIANVIYWLVIILVLTIALPILNVPVINQIVYGFYAYLPNILAAILIIVVAVGISAGIDAIVLRLFGDKPTGKAIAAFTPTLILAIAIFMVLVQLKIATQIVVITYAAIWGALSLGFALAFGLGGREVASKILSGFYESGRRNLDQAKRDMETAKNRGREEIERVKRNR